MVANEEPRDDFSQRLQDLVAFPREELAIELKPWLDLKDGEEAAALGQALLALANHGGGFVLIGFAESEGSWSPAADRPESLAAYNQDAVNGIVARYALGAPVRPPLPQGERWSFTGASGGWAGQGSNL